jgi:hypothetical protein
MSESIPVEIMKKINEYCCIKKHNNIPSRDFLIILKTGLNIEKQIEKNIISWITEIIKNLIIELEELDLDLIYDIGEDEDEIKNEIKILAHFSKPHNLYSVDSDNIICINEYPYGDLINPKKLLDNLNNEHKLINKIGVSGISENLMKDLWWETIDGNEGYMRYNSYCIDQNAIFEQREKSFNFGWNKYPPKN